jgi:uncharacterized membrane protein SpoIIM required for sporulation
MAGVALKSYEFRRERERSWADLEHLVDRVERVGIRALPAADLARLPVLYRSALSSLSVARAVTLDRNVLDYLESLTGRAYFAVYGTRRRLSEAVGGFFLERFPRAVRRCAWPIALAALFLLLGAVTGWCLTSADPDRFYSFVPASMSDAREPSASTADLRASLYTRIDAADLLTEFASFLFGNNARVGLLAFALGFAAGVPVFFLMFTNGLTLGAFAWLFSSRNLSLEFWAWILPHGVTELLAVVLCGAAGLVVATCVVFPGRATRLQNLSTRGREAGVLVLGAVFLFFGAALVEGIFRQVVTNVAARSAVAVTSAAAWTCYFLLAGRERRA